MSDNNENTKAMNLVDVRNEELMLILEKRKAIEISEELSVALDGLSPETKRKEILNTFRDKHKKTEKESAKDTEIDDDAFNQTAFKSNLLGLAFSGGGIRSATFNLGVLQSLAKHKLLRRVDYLSTVSGGGYIGAWFSGLLQREHHQYVDENRGEINTPSPVEKVEERLNPRIDEPKRSHKPEDSAISHLRSYSNYMTPKLGFFTADTWSLIATYLRNVLLNQTILILTIAMMLLVPRLLSDFLGLYQGINETIFLSLTWRSFALIIPTLFFAAIIGWYSGQNIAAVTDTDPKKPNPHDTEGLLLRVLLPLFIVSCLLTGWLHDINDMSPFEKFGSILAVVIILYLAIWSRAKASAKLAYQIGWLPKSDWETEQQNWNNIIIYGIAAAIIVLAPALFGVANLLSSLESLGYSGLQILFGPPLVLMSILFTEVLHMGLASNAFKSQQREWLSRLAAWMLIFSIAWFSFLGIAFYGPLILDYTYEFARPYFVSGWLATTVAGLLAAGQAKKASGVIRKAIISIAPYVFIAGLIILVSSGVQSLLEMSSDYKIKSAENATKVEFKQKLEGAIFYSSKEGQNVTLSFDDATKDSNSFAEKQKMYFSELDKTESWKEISGMLIVLLLFILWFSRRFDINEFSLHKMYENRLSRCYLGATTEDRYQNPFTGFSLQDDIPLWAEKRKNKYFLGLSNRQVDIDSSKDDESKDASFANAKDLAKDQLASAYPGPYPLINTAINLVGGKRLAWQERKAASFLLSPLYCGFQLSERISPSVKKPKDDSEEVHSRWEKPITKLYARIFSKKDENDEKHRGNYQPTKDYASSHFPLTFGDAIATSGAAASSSMGYHTTPALAFLITLFNVRLGRWIGNPIKSEWRSSGPKHSLAALLSEVFGITNDSAKYVYLSDGGHFENLGIYELVRRRCRFIIASDSGADPDYGFEDLANAIRKCRVDLGVNIDIDISEIQKQDEKGNNAAPCALGCVHYPDGNTGQILYIKSSRRHDMPTDVLQYATQNTDFPHQTTADQFFSESQFESYRRLGLHVADHCLKDALNLSKSRDTLNLESLFRHLKQDWYKASTSTGANFTRLAAKLDSLFKQLGARDELAYLDKQFYPEWRVLPAAEVDSKDEPDLTEGLLYIPTKPEEFRAGFYFCNSLIQLMESVYLDLNLADEYSHPDNSGWMNLFKHWSWSGMFQVTWTISAATYGRRFRSFCEHHLDLSIGHISVQPISYNVDTSPIEFEALDKTKSVTLNILEKQQITNILKNHGNKKICEIYQLDLAIHNPFIPSCDAEFDPILRFNFGYAVVINEILAMYRVQDHLRNMELGQRGLKKLFAMTLDIGFNKEFTGDILDELNEESGARRLKSFKDLFDSIKESSC